MGASCIGVKEAGRLNRLLASV